MQSIRASRLFPTRAQRPWLRGRRRLSFSELVSAAESGDADAIEGLLSLALAEDAAGSPMARQALDALRELLEDNEEDAVGAGQSSSAGSGSGAAPRRDPGGRAGPGRSRGHGLARLEVQASCFEYAEKNPAVTIRMPALLLEAASRHAKDRGYHVTGDAIQAALAANVPAKGRHSGQGS